MTRRILGWLVSALCAAAAVVAVPVAQAEPSPGGATLVVLGDSFASNAPQLSGNDECTKEPNSWPNQLAALIGVAGTADFVDESCAGGTLNTRRGWPVTTQARLAAEQQAFGLETRAVFIQAGLNDLWGTSSVNMREALTLCMFNVVQGCGLEAASQNRVPDYNGVTGAVFAERIKPVVDYVKYYAPNAAIVLVGYPEILPPRGTASCVDILGVPLVQVNAAGLVAYVDRLETARSEAAATLGVHDVSLRNLTAGHGLCSADPWLNGIGNPQADVIGPPLHPSTRGNAIVAAALREQFGL